MVSIRDHEQEIYDLIRSDPSIRWGVNNVARKLRMQLNKVVEAYGNLIEIGLLTRHEKAKDWSYPYYTPNQDLIEDYLGFRQNSAEFYEKIMLRHLKSLKRKKIFVNIKRRKTKAGGTDLIYTRSKNAQADYESFKENIKLLISITSTLPFAQVLGIIPKKPKYNKMIVQAQKKSFTTVKRLLDQLYKDHKSQIDAIQNDLKWSIPVLEELQRMPNYFKMR